MKNTTHNHRSNGHNGALHSNGSKAESNGTAALSEPLRFVPVDSPNETNNPGGVIVSGSELLALETPNHVDEYGPSFVEAYPSTEIVTGEPEQYEKIEKAVYALLDAFNVNWEDPNYTDTPKRVAKAYMDYWANGYARDAEDEVTVFPNSSGSGDLVLVKDMKLYSLCSHHLAPFTGYGAIAYMPNEHLLGLSKLGRILDIYSRRFQLQERIGAQTADKIMQLLRPKGVMVVLYDVEHMCMSSRGVKLHEASTTTVATRGIFKEDSQLRAEVMSLIR
ncbi:MAG: GTP cyclohydrolase I [Anaerolineae bacterium]|nr:GTP cyclohydrolase I [Anaerolineae bacterium]MCB9461845.1 GTP cyclohydrolase I [Anaerolineaceae bacterium]